MEIEKCKMADGIYEVVLVLSAAVLDSVVVTPGVSRQDAKFAKGEIARGGFTTKDTEATKRKEADRGGRK